MRLIKSTIFFTIILVSLVAGHYELTAKSPAWLGQALPGWQRTQMVEMITPWVARTGFSPLDRMLHEGEEALLFYHLLPEKSSPRSVLSIFEVTHQS